MQNSAWVCHVTQSTEHDKQFPSIFGSAGDVFGEMALMRTQRRSATVVCSNLPLHESEPDSHGGEEFCVVNKIQGEDFMRMLKQSKGFLKSMNVILRTRMFRYVHRRIDPGRTRFDVKLVGTGKIDLISLLSYSESSASRGTKG